MLAETRDRAQCLGPDPDPEPAAVEADPRRAAESQADIAKKRVLDDLRNQADFPDAAPFAGVLGPR
jgi:hypothetical protein